MNEASRAADLPKATRTLAEVAHSLAAADGPVERMHAAIRLIRQVIPYDRAAVLESVPWNGGCSLYAEPPQEPAEEQALRARLESMMAMMADEGACENQAASPGFAPLNGSAEGHIAIPVVGLNRTIGLLYLESSEGEYGETSLRLLAVLAAQFGAYLTTMRLREEELEHARQLGIALHRLEQTDRKKDEFLAMLGHELRNPLGAINTALQVMDHRGAQELRRYYQVIDRQIRHLSRIVDDLLDASRVRLGKIVLERKAVDLNDVAQRWMDTFGQTALVQAHTVVITPSSTPVIVNVDPVRIDQIFSNILTNALKYTPPGGRIEVAVAAQEDVGMFRVRDTGIGMTPEVLATAFDLFTQAEESLSRSQGGLGLGLPLVRSLVEKHGGTVEATSEGPGKGSEFVIRLPLSESDVPASAGELRAASTPAKALRVLVVEDNEDARETLCDVLQIWGHNAHGVADGLQGVAEATRHTYDVLLVDIGLPKVDGYEVARRIRAQTEGESPRMFAMTGYGQPEDRRRAVDAGFDAHLVKPLNMAELQKLLAAAALRSP